MRTPPESVLAVRPFARWIPLFLAVLGAGLFAFVFWAHQQGWNLARAIEDAEPELKTDRFTIAYAKWGTYWAALINGILSLMLAGTWPWWRGQVVARPVRVMPPVGKWGWGILVASLAVGGWLRWERAGLSLYNDEAHAFKRYVAGDFRPSDQKWRQVIWLKTLFFNKVANNSAPYSVLERLSYEAWLKVTKSAPGTVNERAIRFPVIVASLLGCVLLWATARRLFGNSAAAAVAILSAVHFWMVRYGNEARGYGLTLCAIGLMFYALCRAWEEQRWRWWLAFAAGQWLCLYSFSGTLNFVFVLNLGVLGNLALQVWRQGAPREYLLRPLVALTLAAMLTLQLMLPALPQLAAAINNLDSLKGTMGWLWWKNIMAGLGSGLSFEDVGGGHNFPYVLSQYPGRWVLTVSGGVLLVMGIWRVCRADFLAKVICLAGLIPIPFVWAIMSSRGLFLLPWYVIFALPGLLLIVAANFDRPNGISRWIVWVAGTLLVGSLYGVNLHLAGRGRESVRDTLEFVRNSSSAEVRLFGSFKSDVDTYDKRHVLWDTAAEFEALLERARKEHAELWIAYTREHLIKSQLPDVHARLHDSAEFELVKIFPPMDEQQFTHYLFKWRGQ